MFAQTQNQELQQQTVLKQEITLSEIELEVFGVTHSEVGAYLLGLWGLPDLVVEAIAHHHSPHQVPGKVFVPLSAVYVANTIEHEMCPNRRLGAVQPVDVNYLDEVGLAERLPLWRDICQKAM